MMHLICHKITVIGIECCHVLIEVEKEWGADKLSKNGGIYGETYCPNWEMHECVIIEGKFTG